MKKSLLIIICFSLLVLSCSTSRHIEYREIVRTDSVHDTTTIVQSVFRVDSVVNTERVYVKDSSYTDYLRGRYDSLRGAFVDTLKMFRYHEKDLLRENDFLREQLEKDSVTQRNSEKSAVRDSSAVDDKLSSGKENRPKETLSCWQSFFIYSGYLFWLLIIVIILLLYGKRK